MFPKEDESALAELKQAMEAADGANLASATRKFRIMENNSIMNALKFLEERLSKSPCKSANRQLAFRHVEDAFHRMHREQGDALGNLGPEVQK